MSIFGSFGIKNHPGPKNPSVPQIEVRDVSHETFGKYQYCTSYEGVFYADSDFDHSFGVGKPKKGAIPSPSEADRTPFGQKRKPILESEHEKLDRYKREKIETQALLEQIASEAVPEANAKQDEWLSQYVARHEEDVYGWAFDCKKHGDFLSVFITRASNAEAKQFWTHNPVRFSTTINLAACRQIILKCGHAPARGGSIKFSYRLAHGDKGSMTIGGTGHGCYKAPEGSKWVVLPPEMVSHYSRPLMYFAEPPSDKYGNCINMSDSEYKIKTKVENAARPAADDRIEFEGLRATLFIPATLGQQVHERILKELSA